MKITFFLGSMRRGGAERVISILANHYCSKGWDVEIALLLDTDVQYELNENIKIVDLTAGKGGYFKRLPKWLGKIRKHVKASKPDKILSFIGRINVLVINACRGLKVPIVVSERNDPHRDGRSKFMLWLCNKSYKKASKIVFQTKYQQGCFSKKLRAKSCIIQNPVSVKFLPTKECDELFVTAGRLIAQKNQSMLINAFSLVIEKYPNVKLKIYGDGELKDKLQAQINSLNLQNSVTLEGAVSDLHERIVTAKAFVMTSEFEGASNALIEAMMLGLPCITTDYPGADEVITNGKDGLIIERQNVQSLVDAMIKILNDENLRRSLKEQAILTSNAYKTEKVLRMWEDAIE